MGIFGKNKKAKDKAKPLKAFIGEPGSATGGTPTLGGAVIGRFKPLREFQCDVTGSIYVPSQGSYIAREGTFLSKPDDTGRTLLDRWTELGLIKWL